MFVREWPQQKGHKHVRGDGWTKNTDGVIIRLLLVCEKITEKESRPSRSLGVFGLANYNHHSTLPEYHCRCCHYHYHSLP